jgi:hypothetical protein
MNGREFKKSLENEYDGREKELGLDKPHAETSSGSGTESSHSAMERTHAENEEKKLLRKYPKKVIPAFQGETWGELLKRFMDEGWETNGHRMRLGLTVDAEDALREELEDPSCRIGIFGGEAFIFKKKEK